MESFASHSVALPLLELGVQSFSNEEGALEILKRRVEAMKQSYEGVVQRRDYSCLEAPHSSGMPAKFPCSACCC